MHTASPTTFKEFVEQQLNTPQQQAVLHKHGPLLVIAGAGSGKTRVITARITHLMLHEQVPASRIVALTFTNKAANEMKERIASFLGADAALPFVGTFHAYCVRLLRRYKHLLNIPFETIMDADDQQKLIKDILKKHGLHKQYTPKSISYQISQIKNKNISLDATHTAFADPIVHDIYKTYEHEKQMSKCLDFDDLLLHALMLFKVPAFKVLYQEQVHHVLVDEYQDTNVVQHALLKEMCLKDGTLVSESVCAVGDEDQSIYSWRGATVENIQRFTHDFANTTIIKIEQNYRSIQEVLDVANTVITNNTNRTPKKLWSQKRGINRIHCMTFTSEYQEAEALIYPLQLLQKQNKLNNTALLYRTHAQSRAFEEALIKYMIPYRIIGGVQFYDRLEIRDMLAYLKLITNPYDRIALRRIINVPARGLGEKFEELFFDTWNTQPLYTFAEVAKQLLDSGELRTAQSNALQSFVHIIHQSAQHESPTKMLEALVVSTGYIMHLKKTYEKAEAADRVANVQELVNAFAHLEQNGAQTIAQVLEEITLMQDRSAHKSEERNALTLMTLHAAKGLEFDTVILSGLEEGILPTTRALHEADAIEEERRLLYVGITRARERLLLTNNRYRYTYGQISDQTPSRFMHELPSSLVPHHHYDTWQFTEQRNFFAQWLNVSQALTYTAPTAPQKPKKQHPFNVHIKKTTHKTHDPLAGLKKKPIQRAQSDVWKTNQPVQHAQYGTGIIMGSEKRGDTTFVRVKFRNGIKKIAASFLHKV